MSRSRPSRHFVLVAVCLLAVAGVAGSTAVSVGDAHTGTTDASGVTDADTASAATDTNTASGDADRTNETNSNGSRPTPRVVAVYPNPLADEDRGEYVRLVLPPGEWLLSDGETVVTLRGPGRVTVTPDPGAVETTDRLVRADLTLSNGGERLVVRPARKESRTTENESQTGDEDGRTAQTTDDGRLTNRTDDHATRVVVYRDAPEGSVWLPGPGEWRPAGYEPRPVARLGPANGTAFLLPDTPGLPVETIRAADRRVLVAGYTFGSERIADALVAAADRGVRVRVLVEGGPVGGIARRQARLLSRLIEANVSVRVVGGPAPRVRYHHAKYAVVDDRALVTTENWTPSGVGGASNRGWGVRLDDDRTAAELASVFRTDWTARDAISWGEFRRGRTFEVGESSDGTYPSEFQPTTFHANATYLLTAPGNADRGLLRIVRTADRRIDVLQPSVGSERLLRAVKRAANRGVRVRIVLSSAWYAVEENRRTVAALNAWADRRDAPLSASLASPGGAFEDVHAKGVIVDSTVVVGSLNWTPTSLTENREVAAAVRDARLAAYFRRSIAADRRDPSGRSVPPTLAVVGVGCAALAALLVARRVEFATVGN